MSDPNEPSNDPAGLRGPGDPEAAKERQQQGDSDDVEARQPHAEPGHTEPGRAQPGRAGNIREEQQTQAAGTVPAAYIGSGDPTSDDKPEDAVGAGGWDDEV